MHKTHKFICLYGWKPPLKSGDLTIYVG